MTSFDDSTCFDFETTSGGGQFLQDHGSFYSAALSPKHDFVKENLASEMQKQRGRKRLRKKKAQEVLHQEWYWRSLLEVLPKNGTFTFDFFQKLPSEMDALCYRYSCGLGPPQSAEELAYLDLQAKRGVSS